MNKNSIGKVNYLAEIDGERKIKEPHRLQSSKSFLPQLLVIPYVLTEAYVFKSAIRT